MAPRTILINEPTSPASYWHERAAFWSKQAEELAAINLSLARENVAMRSALQEAEEYLDDRSDVIDGDYGEPHPNREMRLLTEVRAALGLERGI